ncbi:MAG: HEPN domain-containing protein [Patescibacteria group bacterium]
MEADRDYLLARLINFSGYGFASRAGYFGQQAIEKYFKALMVQEEKAYLKTHDLIVLAKYCSKFDLVFVSGDFLRKVKIFDDFREVGRYGGESTYDPHAKKEKDFTTAGVYSWVDTNIKILDETVNVLRKRLDFQAIGFSDSLDVIAKGNNKDFLAGTWKLPINLREVLISDNDNYDKIIKT